MAKRLENEALYASEARSSFPHDMTRAFKGILVHTGRLAGVMSGGQLIEHWSRNHLTNLVPVPQFNERDALCDGERNVPPGAKPISLHV